MQLYLKLRAGLLCYFYLTIAGSVLLTKPASAQQKQTPPTTETQEAVAKAPSGLLDNFKASQNRELIVIYDDTKIQKEAASLRRQQALNQENSQILAFKVAQYAKRKQQILSKVGASGIQVVEDYSHLPLSFVRFQSKAALIRLLASSDVVRVYRNETRARSLVQSLPLIGQPAVAAAGRTGSGTTVAVLDTGVDYTRSAFGCTSPAQPIGCKVVYAQDFATDDNQLDDDGHGTNVAGIVASVAPGTQIAALDVFRPRGGRDTDIIAAINWSIQNKSVYNIVAMNLSLGSSTNNTFTCSNNIYSAPFAQARAVGIIPIVAAGNDGFATGINEPACATGAVSVGAVYDSNLGSLNWRNCPDKFTAADIVTCFSNSAGILTLLAPGALIDAAGIQQGGTSQAAPHVAGAVAVLRSLFPSDTIDQTISRLTNTGVAIADARNGIVKPRLNLLAASETVIPQPVNDNFVSAIPVNGSLVSVTGKNTNATKETGEVDSAGMAGGKSVWWSWTAPKSGNVQITTEGSDFDTLLSVYTGSDVASTTQVAANDDSSASRTSTVTFNAVAGTTYQIAIDGNNGESGNIKLYINATNGADFNSDGKTDILWHRGGYLAVWVMDGVNLVRSVETNPSQPSSRSWKPVSTGDFNNDGNTDILWRHSAGFLSLWLMDGIKLIRSTNLNPRQLSDPSWKIIGTGDFNRDGKVDILWRSDAGFISVWLMDGENLIAGVELNPNQVTDTSWKPVSTGDFNQDAKVDILWQRDDGSLKVWLMDGVNLTSEVNLTPVADTSWKAISTGDFNRDGKTDILWRNNDGYLSVWFMDGINLVSSTYLNPDRVAASTRWKPVGVP